jgi:hypothetical protein
MTSQNTDLSSWDILYTSVADVVCLISKQFINLIYPLSSKPLPIPYKLPVSHYSLMFHKMFS